MDAMRCQYASKPCDQVRTFKENGELHRLCAYHRTRANDAQRRWHSRQRVGPNDDSTTELSVCTKSRRRATQACGGGMTRPRRRRQPNTIKRDATLFKIMKSEAKHETNVWAPESPASVDSSVYTFDSFVNVAPATCGPSAADDDRLSAEDLALLDELMMGLDETPLIMSNATAWSTPIVDFGDHEWSLLTATHFV